MLKQMPHIHKNIIHVGRSKFDGSMLSMQFHFFYTVLSIQLQVGPVIICLVIIGVTCLEDKWGDVVGSEKMCGPFIGVAVMAIKEEDLGVELASSTGSTEDTHILHPAIPVHISQGRVVK